jgi:hypothetical protein
MRMIMLVAAVMAAMVATPAAAESWRLTAENDDTVMFVDTDSVRRDGDRVRVVTMTVVLPARPGEFDRVVAAMDINCSASRYTVVEASMYDGSRLLDSTRTPWPERTLTPNTIINDTAQSACGRRDYISDVIADPYAAAMARLRQPSAPRKSAVARQ